MGGEAKETKCFCQFKFLCKFSKEDNFLLRENVRKNNTLLIKEVGKE